MTADSLKKNFYPWLIWFLPALFYLFQFGIQILPSVINQELMQTFSIGPLGLSILAGAFNFSYLIMQIPTGLLLDRFNVRYLLVFAVILFSIGMALFSFSTNLSIAVLARILTGVGGSFAFVSTLYVADLWLPRAIYALAVGLTETMTSIAIIGIGGVFSVLVKHYSWQTLMQWCVLFALILACAIWFVVREKSASLSVLTKKSSWQEIKKTLKTKQLWYAGLYTGFIFCSFMVMVNVWMVRALERTYNLSPIYAIFINGLVAVGFAVGAPIIGWISSKTNSRTRIMLFCAVGVSIVLIAARFIITALFLKAVCFFLLGFLMGGAILSFAVVKDLVPTTVHGFVAGFVNMFFTLIGILLLPLVGFLLSVTRENFMISMLPVVITTILSIPMALLLKESKYEFLSEK